MSESFESVLTRAEGMTATGIPIPNAVVAALGSGKNPKLVVTARKAGGGGDPYSYRISVGTRDGRYMLSFSSANRQASGFVAGDALEVTVELDTAPRELELPDDLVAALTATGALEALKALSFSKQRAYVDPIVAAKGADTRQRRIDKAVAELSA
jgi:hypothetical protein